MELKLYERKNTTATALKEVQRLFESLNEHIEDDIPNFNGSKTFFCRVTGDNGLMQGDLNRSEWVMTVGTLIYQDGEFKIFVEDYPGIEYSHTSVVSAADFDRIEKLDFKALVAAFEEIVTLYNERAKKKDDDISHFLKLVRDYQD